MKKRVIYPVLCVALVLVFAFSTGMTLAAWKAQGDTINAVTAASVAGQIVEEYEQGQTLYPGVETDKIVQVENTGTADAAVRVKIEKAWGDSRGDDGVLIINPGLSTDNIQISCNLQDWYYNDSDGYFYYKGTLSPGEITPPLLESFAIDGNSGGEYKNKHADILVKMEMVQAAGHGLLYWGMSFAELGVTYVETVQTPVVTTVRFKSPETGFAFEVNGGDLFANFKDLVPGQSRSQQVTVTNAWNRATEIFLWAEITDQTQATDETRALIDKLLKEYATVVITDDAGDVVYYGPVWGNPGLDSQGADSMKYPHSLGAFAAGQTKNLHISLQLDYRMDNEYQELMGLIKWVFSAEDAEGSVEKPPFTGDPIMTAVIFGSLALLSALTLIFLVLREKKKRAAETAAQVDAQYSFGGNNG